jgi:hypothetical protein
MYVPPSFNATFVVCYSHFSAVHRQMKLMMNDCMCAVRFNIPAKYHFSLAHQIRFALGAADLAVRKQVSMGKETGLSVAAAYLDSLPLSYGSISARVTHSGPAASQARHLHFVLMFASRLQYLVIKLLALDVLMSFAWIRKEVCSRAGQCWLPASLNSAPFSVNSSLATSCATTRSSWRAWYQRKLTLLSCLLCRHS